MVIPVVTNPRPAVTWLDKATDAVATASTRAKIGGIAAVAVAAAGLSVLSGAHSGTTSTSSDPTAAAHQAGVAYAKKLRDAGYNSMSVGVNCNVYDSGYSGAQEEAFTVGCADVWTGMVENGES